LVAYHWPRTLQYKTAVSDPIHPTRGIAAGSTPATYDLWLALRPPDCCSQSFRPAYPFCVRSKLARPSRR
jgi:hypothetical protein